jgi:hypothetical protein
MTDEVDRHNGVGTRAGQGHLGAAPVDKVNVPARSREAPLRAFEHEGRKVDSGERGFGQTA